MRSIYTAARRRQRHWRPNSSGMLAATTCCRISIRSVGSTGSSTITSSSSLMSSLGQSKGLRNRRATSAGTTCTENININRPNTRCSMSTSSMASVSCWMQDVLRTKRLSPPNPILESLPSAEELLEGLQSQSQSQSNNRGKTDAVLSSQLPKFSILQPHHLEKAAEEISRQHDVELAQLEVRWTSVSEEDTGNDDDDSQQQQPQPSSSSSSLYSLLLDLDRLTAPVVQLQEVSELYETLASPPDKIKDWTEAADSVDSKTTKNFVENLYRSRIVYRALATAISESTTAAKATSTTTTMKHPSSFLVPFLKRGAHIENNSGDPRHEAEGLQQIQQELSVLNDRLDNVVSYDRASKAMRLQCMSDMYNCIGLSRLQAESLQLPDNNSNDNNNNNSVWDLARLQHNHMVESPQEELTDALFPEIASSLQSYLPKQAKLDLDGVGAFLEGKSVIGNAINSGGSVDSARTSLKAKWDFKQRIRLHGVMKGFIDFCDQILGITIVEDTEANNGEAGWSKNVRLLHLYEKAEDEGNEGDYLGTIYFDPFADSYWRTEDAKDLVNTRLFTQQPTGQTKTTAPIAIVALKITPIWDDTPVPMTWKDTRDLLHQFGQAIQLILDQSRVQRNYHKSDYETIEQAPIDASNFMAHFLELWLQNDGFLQRLAQLSQDELILDDETLKTLRKDLRNEKALELTNTMFLSALQFTIFDSFDPRGDETLVALQERLAVQYLPSSNLPDPSDLSPLLAVFQESGIDQKMSAYGTLWSEVLACTVYETFQKTDLRDKQEVTRLGTGIRNLFLCGNRGRPVAPTDFADLCKIDGSLVGSGGPLKRVYGFDDAEKTKLSGGQANEDDGDDSKRD